MPGLRVIAGEAKGRRLKLVPGEGTRPISDRVKEALFSILGPEVEDSAFLDLFAGTGSVGIEALSRGAARAVFVDSNPRALATIRANLEATGFSSRSAVVRADVFAYLESLPDGGFDYIYIAPPQYRGLWEKALRAIDATAGWLAPGASVVVQIHPKEMRAVAMESLALAQERRYGSTLLAFFESK